MNPQVDREFSNKGLSKPSIKMTKSTRLNRTNSTISIPEVRRVLDKKSVAILVHLMNIIVLAEVQPKLIQCCLVLSLFAFLPFFL